MLDTRRWATDATRSKADYIKKDAITGAVNMRRRKFASEGLNHRAVGKRLAVKDQVGSLPPTALRRRISCAEAIGFSLESSLRDS